MWEPSASGKVPFPKRQSFCLPTAARALLPAIALLLSVGSAHAVTSSSATTIGTGSITLHNATVRTTPGNSSCIIVGCDSRAGLSDADRWWQFYRRSGYATAQVRFQNTTHDGDAAYPHWCRIPAVMQAQRQHPRARVLYVDTDTRVDFKRWCDTPGLGPAAPIIMNSEHRNQLAQYADYSVHGNQVQTNAFVVAPGMTGVRAMRRWEDAYYDGMYQDQGAINRLEGMLCGVPGWIQCAANGEGSGCHCTGSSHGMPKSECIKRLFAKTLFSCPLP